MKNPVVSELYNPAKIPLNETFLFYDADADSWDTVEKRVYQISIDVVADDGACPTEDMITKALASAGIEVVGTSQDYSWDYDEYFKL